MPKTSTRVARSILFSLLLGTFPVLALWRTNLGQLAMAALWLPLLITLGFIVVTFGLGLLIGRTWEKAGLFSALTSVFVLSFGHLYNLVGQKEFLGISLGFLKLILVWSILYIALVVLLLRVRHVNNSVFLFGNLLGVALLVLNLVPCLVYGYNLNKTSMRDTTPALEAASSDEARPDIYYIVFDAYARSDIMKEVTGYDNSAFIAALEERGFFVPECAFSNYAITTDTITSVLNLDYLSAFGVADDEIGAEERPSNQYILDNQVREIAHKYGYLFVTGRGYNSITDVNNSDLYLNYWRNTAGADNLDKERFMSLYFNTTVLRVFSEIYQANPEKAAWLPYWLAVDRESDSYLKEASFWYYQNNFMLDSLETIPEKTGNYLVYAHINAPHGPYVFRADGSFNYPLDSNDNKVLYAEAVQYLDRRILEVIDTLQTQSEVQPIIILQADHSIHSMTAGLDKHKILSAYYLPGELNTPPYDTITPVNNFRLILKNYFDPSEQLLPDTLFVKFLNDYEGVPSSCDLNNK
jgi:hypothetical protein